MDGPRISPYYVAAQMHDLACFVQNAADKIVITELQDPGMLQVLRDGVATLGSFIWATENQSPHGFEPGFEEVWHQNYEDFWTVPALQLALERTIEDPNAPLAGGAGPAWSFVAEAVSDVAGRLFHWGADNEVRYDSGHHKAEEVAHV